MVDNGVSSKKSKLRRSLALTGTLLTACVFLLSACKSSPFDIKRDIAIPKEAKETKRDKPIPPKPEAPEFVPVSEDASPLKTRMIDIVAKNISLGDVINVIAEATNLNLALDKDVDTGKTLSLNLKNVTAEDALNTVFTSFDYYWALKNNMLIVKAVDTKIFEIGHPAVTQTLDIDIGGDIIGGAMSAAGGSASNIKGNITQKVASDKSALDFWTAIEGSVGNIMGASCGSGGGGSAARTQTASTPTQQTAQPAAQSLLQSQGQTVQLSAPSQAGPVSAARETCSVNKMAGTIMVTTTKRNMEKIEQYINVVKKVLNRQVVVEAKIIEVNLNNNLTFGIDWSAVRHSMSSADRFAASTISTLPSANFTTSGGFSSVLSTGSFFTAKWGRGDMFQIVLNALQTQGDIRTLSNPRINLMNGQTALLGVGRSRTYLAKIQTNVTAGTTTTTSTTTEDRTVLSGLMIGIVPYISDAGEITLTVTPIISELQSLDTIALSGGNTIQLPTIDLREMSTTVKVKDDEMVVIGGLIKRKEGIDDKQVPLLGSIPLLGNLFKSKAKTDEKTELVVILHPVLVSR
ncbi:MAG: pilus (MSHA type) biogenesis protein MshL [Nitrospirae bacterium]|nr:MAG: pilus (MSHA type) biogenesis protein MshL [Nitrospirota bacterium]